MERRDFLKSTAAVGIALAASSGGMLFAGSKKKMEDEEYHRLENKDKPTVLEQKHVPGIEAPSSVKAGEWFDVKIKVGFQTEHPTTPEHWIQKIKLKVDGEKVAKAYYPKGGVAPSSATFRIRLDRTTKIEAVEHCNLHGTWISEPMMVTVS